MSEIDDKLFLELERLNNPERFRATEEGWNPCECQTCERLRKLLAPAPPKVLVVEPHPDADTGRAAGFDAFAEFLKSAKFNTEPGEFLTLRDDLADATSYAFSSGVFPDTGIISAERKASPVATGVVAYFPDALIEVARVSQKGNDKHNPGEPLHWAREKSTDEADALMRHLLDYLAGDDHDPEDNMPHLAKVAWRALALLQRWCDGEEPGRIEV